MGSIRPIVPVCTVWPLSGKLYIWPMTWGWTLGTVVDELPALCGPGVRPKLTPGAMLLGLGAVDVSIHRPAMSAPNGTDSVPFQ